jgi:hypothetical protein
VASRAAGTVAVKPDHPAHQYFNDFDRLAIAEVVPSLAWKLDPELRRRSA